MARSYPYKFKENYTSEMCVVKFWFGKKFFIWKAKALKQTTEQVMRDLDRKIRLGTPETDLFYQVVQHCRRYRPAVVEVEVLFATENHQQLFDFEMTELERICNPESCLNAGLAPYIPKWLNVTQNKALQSLEKPSDVPLHQNEPEIEPEPIKMATEVKIPSANTDVLKSIARIAELKRLKNSNNGQSKNS